jgi:hypothetical protein
MLDDTLSVIDMDRKLTGNEEQVSKLLYLDFYFVSSLSHRFAFRWGVMT